MYGRCRSCLVAVQLGDAFFGIRGRKFRSDPLGHRSKLRFARRDVVHGGKNFTPVVPLGKLLDQLISVFRAVIGALAGAQDAGKPRADSTW